MTRPRPAAGLPREWYFTPGPTQLHPTVPAALASGVQEGLGSESHRSPVFRSVLVGTVEVLRALLEIPEGHRVLFLSSATEAMERVVHGGVSRRSLHLVNGAFARRFHEAALGLGREAGVIRAMDGEGFDLDAVEIPEDVELVAVTQNETSTGVALDPDEIRRLGTRLAGRLLAVDTVTAAPTAPLDLSQVDAAFFSVQKLFGLPAGLAVLVASPALIERARELRSRGISTGGYIHLGALAEKADGGETVVTPNTLGIHLLGEVARAYLARGVTAIRSDAEVNAGRLASAARKAGWEDFVPEEADRSRTVLIFRVPQPAKALVARLGEKGFRVGTGYGPHKDACIRIANFPVHPPEAVSALAEAIEAL